MTQTKSQETIQPRDLTGESIVVRQRGSTSAILYRFLSTLDADVHVTLEGTDDIDGESFAETESLPIGGDSGDPDPETKYIAAGDTTTQIDSTLLTEGWPWLRFTVTPQTSPTSGEFELRDIKNF
ncbi:hypothetical protein [Haloarcula montana]|uniref:hypothetical protein n=1 Tax=Haloarcula montana TaxID=3111776 RepID=UPI002D789E14|nr:hypothetical protein [Haloarcula sp. GH36]